MAERNVVALWAPHRFADCSINIDTTVSERRTHDYPMTSIDAGRDIGVSQRAALSAEDASSLAERLFGLEGRAQRLDGEYDENFRIDAGDRSYVLKVASPNERQELVDLQVAALRHLKQGNPRVASTEIDGVKRWVRLMDFVPGTLLADVSQQSARLLRSLGAKVATVDLALRDFDHPAAHRELQWDLLRTGDLRDDARRIPDERYRTIATTLLDRIALEVLPVAGRLRRSVIHGDPNDYNVIVADDRVVALIDFGDTVHSATVCDVAIAAAYAMTGTHDPLGAAAHVVAGYESVLPLQDAERRLLFPLILARLVMSVVISAARKERAPGQAYYTIHEERAWRVLEQLHEVPFDLARDVLCSMTTTDSSLTLGMTAGVIPSVARDLQLRRRELLGANLSLSYKAPLHIVRGWKQYLYDSDGREFLDAYNNVAHVGHSHPKVIEAVTRQMAVLNTNTRYLHENVLEYAERLAAKLPEPLRVCYFVNSGSEANELALRLARAFTGQRDVIVMEGSYHGNTQRMIEVSPYKFDGPGGKGRVSDVHVVPIPDMYRHPERSEGSAVADAVAPSAFLVESMPSVAGQIVLPPGYLKDAFAAVRKAGGVCIVDEVQVGLGRVGSRFWGFELQDVVPDVVVMGKPLGNGHPLGAVVTRPEIAAAFANGMEYFNTFGGNPVSMAAGLAVLDVLEEEELQQNALRVGSYMLDRLRDLQARHAIIGDVRGSGFFIGVELVRDRETLEPATQETSGVVNALKDAGILTGTEGPHQNVLKIRPPMCFDRGNADHLVEQLDAALTS
jgi:4-aminobutyrate aminotransferase-like enzyme/Ser/Thr protein kinase RdoA (MazF antagonist)